MVFSLKRFCFDFHFIFGDVWGMSQTIMCVCVMLQCLCVCNTVLHLHSLDWKEVMCILKNVGFNPWLGQKGSNPTAGLN